MPELVSIVYTPADVERKPRQHYARVPAERAVLVADKGIAGDVKGRGGDRQLNVMLAEIVDDLHGEGYRAGPGELGEQLIIRGVPAGALAVGARLRLGDEAVIELTLPRTGCDRFETIQGHTKQSVEGRLGYMARVVAGGDIAVVSEVRLEEPRTK